MFATTLCLLAGLQEPPEDPSKRDWPIGFQVVQTEEVPTKSWIEYWPSECVYEVTESAEGLEIRFSGTGAYVLPAVHLWLTPDGARAQASYGDCTSIWQPECIAGTACLVTDGKVATLQFEVYEGGADWIGKSLRGQVELGSSGIELARRWSKPTASGRHERFEYSCSCGSFFEEREPTALEVSGTLDSLGRRQGLWVVRKAGASEPIVEMMWRDGFPDGIYREYDNESFLLSVGQHRDGFEDGQQMTWYRDGKRNVSEYDRGSLRRVANYGPNGEALDQRPAFPSSDPTAHWEKVRALYTRR